MGIQSFPSIDYETGMQSFFGSGATASIGTTYTTILSLSGKGKLFGASLQTTTTNDNYLRITLDGVVIWENRHPGTGSGGIQGVSCGRTVSSSGFLTVNPPNSVGAVLNFGLLTSSTTTKKLPFVQTASAQSNYGYHPVPYIFNSSLLIEAKSSATDTFLYFYEGVYK